MHPLTEDLTSVGALAAFVLMVAMWARLIEAMQIG